eukprot:2313424-Amphidinium_carterae.1
MCNAEGHSHAVKASPRQPMLSKSDVREEKPSSSSGAAHSVCMGWQLWTPQCVQNTAHVAMLTLPLMKIPIHKGGKRTDSCTAIDFLTPCKTWMIY